MGTPDRPSLFRSWPRWAALALLLGGLAACAPARVRGAGPRPWPENAVDREIRRLSEQAVAAADAPAGPASSARQRALWAELQRLPAEESRPYRLDRALLAEHLRAALDPSAQTLRTPEAAPALEPRPSPAAAADAQALIERLEAAGVGEARGLSPAWAGATGTATTARRPVDAVLAALAARVRPQLPLSPARRAFEAPGARAAWVALGPAFLADLGAGPEPAARGGGGLALAYERLRARRGSEFRPWDVMRVLLGLGSDDPALVEDALGEAP